MTKDEFATLHRSDDPLILFNVWDAGSARAVATAGAVAIATGSASVAGAQGFEDGERMPFAALVQTASQIAGCVDLPLTVDMESGYASNLVQLSGNAKAMHAAGAIGCNLEDRLIDGGGLRSVGEQADRIAAVDQTGLFVNARTDTFLGPLMKGEDPNRDDLVDAAVDRAAAYAEAGARCFFIPGLSDTDMIARLCAAVSLPVNVMRLPGMVGNAQLADLGVSRISYGPAPWRDAMAGLTEAARSAFAR